MGQVDENLLQLTAVASDNDRLAEASNALPPLFAVSFSLKTVAPVAKVKIGQPTLQSVLAIGVF